jgi:hypothetical protein
MGASGWSYFVPYEADVSAALQRLREDVFARGDYAYGDGLSDGERKAILERVRPKLDPWVQKVREQAATMQEPMKTIYLETMAKIKGEIAGDIVPSRKPKQKPKTIEKLLEIQAESGTHSILDIVCISPKPKFGAISPIPQNRLGDFFDSETPSRVQIEEVHESGSLEEFVSERWQGIYIVAYHKGLPSELFFAGCSGD